MRTLRYIISVAFLVAATFSMKAQTGTFLNVPSSARELAVGGVNAGADAESVLDEQIIAADISYKMWSPAGVGTNMINADVAYRLGKLAILADCGVNTYDPYFIYDGSGIETGTYTPNEFAFAVGAAYKVIPGLGISVMAKYVGTDLAPEAKKATICSDVNAAYQFGSLSVGVSGNNVGSSALPMLVEAGARKIFGFGKALKFQAGADIGFLTQGKNRAVTASAGIDIKIIDMISVMAGYHFSSNTAFEPSYVSAGLGVDIAMIKISAAYLTGNPYIGNTIGFTLGCAF